jgi:hypothetical protein
MLGGHNARRKSGAVSIVQLHQFRLYELTRRTGNVQRREQGVHSRAPWKENSEDLGR